MGIVAPRDLVIHNGADANIFRPLAQDIVCNWRRQRGLEHKRLLLTVGNVTDRKGQEIVIRALPYLIQAGQDVHYLMIGLPTLQDKLRALSDSLGVTDKVHFLGRVDAQTLLEAYNACDVFVMVSRHCSDGDFEGYGIAAIEAALCGKPAVVTRGSGLEEAVLAEQTGLLVPENDPVATATAILCLLTDEHLKCRLGLEARKRTLAHQTWDHCGAVYDEVLRDILEQHAV
jgi:phosphatidylinositol alpha-1,6-mannosyltransferase